MKKTIKNYMTAIYKMYGDCRIDQFADLSCDTSKEYSRQIEFLRSIEAEIISELSTKKLSENIYIMGSIN